MSEGIQYVMLEHLAEGTNGRLSTVRMSEPRIH